MKCEGGLNPSVRNTWICAYWRFIIFALVLSTSCAGEAPGLNAAGFKRSGGKGSQFLNVSVARIHDPSIAKERATYYVFSTTVGWHSAGQLPIHCGKDLANLTLCGYVFGGIPGWIRRKFPRIRSLWAPDVSFFNGKYHVYYAASRFGKNTSVIALATNRTLNPSDKNYKWVDEGEVIESTTKDDWNAIDPNIIVDSRGRVWMAFGSFWGGIKMVRIDPRTGKRFAGNSALYSLAARPADSTGARPIEAPFIFPHHHFYYLFVSFDYCCRGANSNYKIEVGRSQQVTGPYRNRNGVPMMEGAATLVLQGGNQWRGPGGESLLKDGRRDLLVLHAYSAKSGKPFFHVRRIQWAGGWPQVAPLK